MWLWRLEIPQLLTSSLVSLCGKCGVAACICCLWWWTALPGIVVKLGSKNCSVYMSIRMYKVMSNTGILDINDATGFAFLYQETSMQGCLRVYWEWCCLPVDNIWEPGACLWIRTHRVDVIPVTNENRIVFCWKKWFINCFYWKKCCENIVRPWCGAAASEKMQ